MKVTKGDKELVKKMKIGRDEWEKILKTSKKGSWAYRIAKERLEEMDKGRI